MRFHQVIASSHLKIKCRDISCPRLREQGKFDCPCFELKEVELVVNGKTAASPVDEVVADTQPTSTGSQQGATSYEIGSWCVLLYDEVAYPGKILDLRDDGDLKVSCLHSGQNLVSTLIGSAKMKFSARSQHQKKIEVSDL